MSDRVAAYEAGRKRPKPRNDMKTTKAIAKGLLLGAAMIAVAILAGCTPKAFPVGPNPLDEPWQADSTESLHTGNLRAITGNPAL